MDNKGFTLIEMVLIILIISLIFLVIVRISTNTFSITNEKSYEITKSNIINATDKYILECNNKVINCDLQWNDNKTIVKASSLIEAGYFKEIINPINNKNLKECLTIEVKKQENKYKYSINDNNCK